MRLLHTHTFQLETFEGERLPQYAILSHRWGADELCFDDVMQPSWQDSLRTLGAQKVIDACGQARRDGLKYIWVDTCCINKASSAELSESINSMFRWYELSDVCYSFLFDVRHPSYPTIGTMHSQWFDRGWTLQELIAPRKVNFYTRNWRLIGDRTGMSTYIANLTGIDRAILRHRNDRESLRDRLSLYSVAARLSWYGRRKTTRLEDQAYCLMGLFDVNMPLLYGEGHKAFPRLLEEIIRKTCDPSIIVLLRENSLVLGNDPRAYELGKDVRRLHLIGDGNSRLFTSRTGELTLEAPVYPILLSGGEPMWKATGGSKDFSKNSPDGGYGLVALLDCTLISDLTRIGLFFTPLPGRPGVYKRKTPSYVKLRVSNSGSIFMFHKDGKCRSLFLSPPPPLFQAHELDVQVLTLRPSAVSFPQKDVRRHTFQITTDATPPASKIGTAEIASQEIIQSDSLNFKIKNTTLASEACHVLDQHCVCLHISDDSKSKQFYVVYGCVRSSSPRIYLPDHFSTKVGTPWCKVLSLKQMEDLRNGYNPFSEDTELGGFDMAARVMMMGNDERKDVYLDELKILTTFQGGLAFLGHRTYTLLVDIDMRKRKGGTKRIATRRLSV